MRTSKKHRAELGNCYEAAAIFMFDRCSLSNKCNLILVHGEVAGQGHLEGITFGHAWILDGNTVIDNSNNRNVILPKEVYYAIGKIEEINNFFEYSWEKTRENLLRYKHYGPWDLKTRSGL